VAGRGDADLPDTRRAAGSGLVPLADGCSSATNADGATATTWKSVLVGDALTEWQPQAELRVGVTDAVAVQNGDYVWVYGGTDAGGQATGAVQRGTIGTGEDDEGRLVEWGVRPVGNLPEARTNAAGWAANGALYLVGGSDGTRPRSELYWVTPTTDRELGDIVTDWKHLAPSDLPAQGLAGAASLVSGPNAFLVGGETADGPIAAAARSNLAPQEPFFRAGLLGAVVPALKIDGESVSSWAISTPTASGSRTAILLAIGWAYAHGEQTCRLWNRITRRGCPFPRRRRARRSSPRGSRPRPVSPTGPDRQPRALPGVHPPATLTTSGQPLRRRCAVAPATGCRMAQEEERPVARRSLN
jgi:hypothetical protein